MLKLQLDQKLNLWNFIFEDAEHSKHLIIQFYSGIKFKIDFTQIRLKWFIQFSVRYLYPDTNHIKQG